MRYAHLSVDALRVPPDTAKSALVRCLAQVFGGSYFERLLTKFFQS